ncbi:MAG: hypothetical protein CVU41_16515 [Chloroflexi bacterium HGW-Chloroflexi-3]|nr:MAG: hypothetical protein CVU41_16515 [Chloroflexi bacterium HGW-Chloroflexi-3]
MEWQVNECGCAGFTGWGLGRKGSLNWDLQDFKSCDGKAMIAFWNGRLMGVGLQDLQDEGLD